MSGLLSATAIFVTWQAPLLKCLKTQLKQEPGKKNITAKNNLYHSSYVTVNLSIIFSKISSMTESWLLEQPHQHQKMLWPRKQTVLLALCQFQLPYNSYTPQLQPKSEVWYLHKVIPTSHRLFKHSPQLHEEKWSRYLQQLTEQLGILICGGNGSGFFLACKDFGGMVDHSFPTCAFVPFFLCVKWKLASTHNSTLLCQDQSTVA